MEKLECCGYPFDNILAVSTQYRRVADKRADILRQHSPHYA